MRQLETIVGERAFRDGLREYLKTYAFGNATWLDLVRILDARTPEDVSAWSRAWVEERGRPIFTVDVRTERGRVSRLTLNITDPLERGLVWPQRMRVALGYRDRVREFPVYVTGATADIREAEGQPQPLFVLANGAGLGYGLFILDDASADYLLQHIEDIADPLTRGSAWLTLWDNVLESRVSATAFLDAAIRALPAETDEQNLQRVLGYATRAFWRHASRAGSERPRVRAGIDAARRSRPRPIGQSRRLHGSPHSETSRSPRPGSSGWSPFGVAPIGLPA